MGNVTNSSTELKTRGFSLNEAYKNIITKEEVIENIKQQAEKFKEENKNGE